MRSRAYVTILLTLTVLVVSLVAQTRPGNFSTLNTTDTSAASIRAGCAQSGAASTCTGGVTGGTLTMQSAGTHSFSGASATANTLELRNTTSGTGAFSRFQLGNNSSATLGVLDAYSSAYTTSGSSIASGLQVAGTGAGGLTLSATNASGVIHFFAANSTTERLRMNATSLSPITTGVMDIGTTSLGFGSLNLDLTAAFVRAGTLTMIRFANPDGVFVGGGTTNVSVNSVSGLIIQDPGAKPTCAVGIRGAIFYDAGGAGVADTLEVCRKDGADAYAWVALF